MPLSSRMANLWRNLFRKSAVERDLDDELRAARETLEARYGGAGMSPAAARRAARLALGGEPVKDAVRDVRVGVQIESIVADVRYALRTLRKSPAFTAAAILSLALASARTPPSSLSSTRWCCGRCRCATRRPWSTSRRTGRAAAG